MCFKAHRAVGQTGTTPVFLWVSINVKTIKPYDCQLGSAHPTLTWGPSLTQQNEHMHTSCPCGSSMGARVPHWKPIIVLPFLSSQPTCEGGEGKGNVKAVIWDQMSLQDGEIWMWEGSGSLGGGWWWWSTEKVREGSDRGSCAMRRDRDSYGVTVPT